MYKATKINIVGDYKVKEVPTNLELWQGCSMTPVSFNILLIQSGGTGSWDLGFYNGSIIWISH